MRWTGWTRRIGRGRAARLVVAELLARRSTSEGGLDIVKEESFELKMKKCHFNGVSKVFQTYLVEKAASGHLYIVRYRNRSITSRQGTWNAIEESPQGCLSYFTSRLTSATPTQATATTAYDLLVEEKAFPKLWLGESRDDHVPKWSVT